VFSRFLTPKHSRMRPLTSFWKSSPQSSNTNDGGGKSSTPSVKTEKRVRAEDSQSQSQRSAKQNKVVTIEDIADKLQKSREEEKEHRKKVAAVSLNKFTFALPGG
jgi:hypothetical protein